MSWDVKAVGREASSSDAAHNEKARHLAMPGFRVEPIVDRATQSIRIRALRNIRSHGESSGQSSGAQLRLALRGVRSGWGLRYVAPPSSLDRPALAAAEPLGVARVAVAGLPMP